MSKKINACIIGASGYTGIELIRLLYSHPMVNIKYLVADSNAGKRLAEIYSHMGIYQFPDLVKLDAVDFKTVDVVFCCLPHATTHKVALAIPKHVKIIDLSADFRLKDTATYEKWYGIKHEAGDLQKEAVYGLTELFEADIKKARLIACPGCYPTSIILPLFPLLKSNLIVHDDIICDSKSGITGAGRSAKQDNLFAEINEGVKAYNICKHRHIAEIEQALSIASNTSAVVNFTPQVVPMNRGILSTIYIKLKDGVTVADIRDNLIKTYKNKSFVHVLPEGQLPSTREVYSTNNCVMAVVPARSAGRAVIVSVIDNLVKGASGQAVQNMNLLFSLDQMTGLNFTAVYP